MEYLNILDYLDILEYRRDRVIRDRSNPMEEYDEADFRIRYRFSKESALFILGMVEAPLQRRQDRAHRILPVIQLLVCLRFMATGGFLKLVGDSFGLHVSSVSRIVRNVSQCIARQRERFLYFPNGNDAVRIQREFMEQGNIPGIVGAIDCTHVPIISPGNDNAELFRNRKGFFSLNVQAVCDSRHRFTNIVVRWPGSTHDSRIFENSELSAKFENGEYTGTLVGDNGYPLRRYLLTPVLQPQTRAEQRYNNHLSRVRVRVENLFGIWKRRFSCLRNQLRLKLQTSMVVVVACAVLHNIARERNEAEPDDIVAPPDMDVPVAPVIRNEGGQAVRNLIIQRFQ